jgi:NADH:ubiquinone oxidoreductase subunit 5 (subunit L)/multisubunit Na+/H+ antiporter MnhA subunit
VGEGKESYPPSHSGMKAFIMTRFGDVLMLVGVFLIIVALGTANFLELQQGVASIAGPYKFLLLPAACSYSAEPSASRAAPADGMAPRRHGRPDHR